MQLALSIAFIGVVWSIGPAMDFAPKLVIPLFVLLIILLIAIFVLALREE